MSAGQVAFSLAPRLNAAGRMSDASVGVQLLLSSDSEQAEELATQLDAQNRERQAVEDAVFAEAERWIESHADLARDRALVVQGEGWHPGVIGIVAARLVETYCRPTIVLSIADGEAVGSARSISAFNIYEGLCEVADYLVRFGGHHMAAGLTVEADRGPRIPRSLLSVVDGQLTTEDLVPTHRVDAAA